MMNSECVMPGLVSLLLRYTKALHAQISQSTSQPVMSSCVACC